MARLKKHLALLLALTMVLSLGAVPALAAPEAAVTETVILDNDLVTLTVTDYDPDGEYGPTFEVLVDNKSDRPLGVRTDYAAVNGVMCDPAWGESVAAGKKAYSEISWYPEDLAEVGVNYIQDVKAKIVVYDGESYDTLAEDSVAWTVDVAETDLPAREPVQFDHGFTPVEVLTGDVVFTVMDYDPVGSYDGGPALVFYLENNTDRPAWFTIDDVSVNGFMCDPWWGETVAPGTAAYSKCEWWADDLEDSHIDAVETVEFTLSVPDDETWDELAETTAVTLDLVGGTSTAAEAPADDAGTVDDAGTAETVILDDEVAAIMGRVEDGSYINDYFGVTFTPTEDWTFATQEELLEQYNLAAERFEGTEMGEQIETFMESEDGFSVMMAIKEGGLQNVNAQVLSLPGLGKYLTESEVLTLAEQEMGLGEGGDMTALGLEGATMTRNTFTFAGAEHEAFRVDYVNTDYGIEMTMYMQMVFIMGEDYVLDLTITTVFEDQTADVGAMFTLAE